MKPFEQFTFYFEDELTSQFVKNYIEYLFNASIANWGNNRTYFLLQGYGDIKNKINQLKQSIVDEKVNLVFIDADKDFVSRKKFLEDFILQSKVDFRFFIFPNDNSPGEIEHLIYDIASKQDVKKCFSHYEKCIEEQGLYIPDIKGKLYAYRESLTPPDRRKDSLNSKIIDYKSDAFNLDSNELTPIKKFLEDVFL